MKLFPILASAFAQSFGTNFMIKHFEAAMLEMKSDKFDRLPLLHHFTSGMKAYCTQEAYDSLLVIRQSIGGAGYSAWSGLP